MSILAERIVAILKANGIDWQGRAKLRRTYAGRHQLAAGAWVWFLEGDGPYAHRVGGYWPASALVRGPCRVDRNDNTGDLSVEPDSGHLLLRRSA